MEDIALNIIIKDEKNTINKKVIAKKETYNKYIKYEFKENNDITIYKIFEDSINIIKTNESQIKIDILLSNKISSKAKIIFENKELPLQIELIKLEINNNIKVEYQLEGNYHLIEIKKDNIKYLLKIKKYSIMIYNKRKGANNL